MAQRVGGVSYLERYLMAFVIWRVLPIVAFSLGYYDHSGIARQPSLVQNSFFDCLFLCQRLLDTYDFNTYIAF